MLYSYTGLACYRLASLAAFDHVKLVTVVYHIRLVRCRSSNATGNRNPLVSSAIAVYRSGLHLLPRLRSRGRCSRRERGRRYGSNCRLSWGCRNRWLIKSLNTVGLFGFEVLAGLLNSWVLDVENPLLDKTELIRPIGFFKTKGKNLTQRFHCSIVTSQSDKTSSQVTFGSS